MQRPKLQNGLIVGDGWEANPSRFKKKTTQDLKHDKARTRRILEDLILSGLTGDKGTNPAPGLLGEPSSGANASTLTDFWLQAHWPGGRADWLLHRFDAGTGGSRWHNPDYRWIANFALASNRQVPGNSGHFLSEYVIKSAGIYYPDFRIASVWGGANSQAYGRFTTAMGNYSGAEQILEWNGWQRVIVLSNDGFSMGLTRPLDWDHNDELNFVPPEHSFGTPPPPREQYVAYEAEDNGQDDGGEDDGPGEEPNGSNEDPDVAERADEIIGRARFVVRSNEHSTAKLLGSIYLEVVKVGAVPLIKAYRKYMGEDR